MQQRYIETYDDTTLVEEPAITNAEVGIVPFDELEFEEQLTRDCVEWKNCVLSYTLTVHSPDNEKLVKSGVLHTNFMPGLSTAICMTSNLEFDASMTPEDVQRFTLAALVRDRPADQDTGRDAQIRQSMEIYENYKGRMDEFLRDHPGLFEEEQCSRCSQATSSANTSHTSQDTNTSIEVDSVPDPVPQLVSNQETRRQTLLRRFSRKANRRQFLTCSFCPGKSFRRLASYAAHLDREHSLENEIMCTKKHCPRSIVGFRTVQESAQHNLLCHRNLDRRFDLQSRRWCMRRNRARQN